MNDIHYVQKHVFLGNPRQGVNMIVNVAIIVIYLKRLNSLWKTLKPDTRGPIYILNLTIKKVINNFYCFSKYSSYQSNFSINQWLLLPTKDQQIVVNHSELIVLRSSKTGSQIFFLVDHF